MSSAKTVQLRTREAVVQAYENWSYPCFSITQGSQLNCKFEGGDINAGIEVLEKMLDYYESSAAIYTLNVFEEKPDKGIKNNTPCDGSINFQLKQKPDNYVPAEIHGLAPGKSAYDLYRELGELRFQDRHQKAQIATLTAEVKALEKENDQLQSDLEKHAEKKPGFMGMIEPMLPEIITRLATAFGIATPPVTALGNVTIPEPSVKSPEQKMEEALGILYQKDPDFHDSLYRMAMLSQKHPEMFALYIQQLKTMDL